MAEGYIADIEKRRLEDATATADQLARLGNRHETTTETCIAALSTKAPPDLDTLGAALAPKVVEVKTACDAKVKAGEAHLARYRETALADVVPLTRAHGESLTALATTLRPECEGWQTRHFCRGSGTNIAEAYADPSLKTSLEGAERAAASKRGKMAVVAAGDALRQQLANPATIESLFSQPIAAMAAASSGLSSAESACAASLSEVGRLKSVADADLAKQREEHLTNKRGLELDQKRISAELAENVRRLEDTVTKIAARDAAVRCVDAALARVAAECQQRSDALEAARMLAEAQRTGADAARTALTALSARCGEEAAAAAVTVSGVREAVKMALLEVNVAVGKMMVLAATRPECPDEMRQRVIAAARALSAVADAKCEACAMCPTCRPDEAPAAACKQCAGCGVCAAAGLSPEAAVAEFDPLNPQAHHPVPADDDAVLRRGREVMMRSIERIDGAMLEEDAVRAADAAAVELRAMKQGVEALVCRSKFELDPEQLTERLETISTSTRAHLDKVHEVLGRPLARRGIRHALLDAMAHADDDAAAPTTLSTAIGDMRLLLEGKAAKVARDAEEAWRSNDAARKELVALLDELATATARVDHPKRQLRAAAALRPATVVFVKAKGEVWRFMRREGGELKPHLEV